MSETVVSITEDHSIQLNENDPLFS